MPSSPVTILTPTRNRPDRLRRMARSLGATVERKDRVVHRIYVDDDDTSSLALRRSGEIEDLAGYRVAWVVGPRPRVLSDAWNALWREIDPASLLIGICDDLEFLTPGWDEILRRHLTSFADGIAVGYIPDPSIPNALVIPCGTGPTFAAMGYFTAPYFPYWFSDAWLDEIALMIERRITLPIAIHHEKGKTHGMRNLPFWWEFYHRTRIERQEVAEKLRRLIHPIGSVGYERSRRIEATMVVNAEREFQARDIAALERTEAALSGETGPPSAAYRAIEAEAIRHLERLEAKQRQKEKLDRLWAEAPFLPIGEQTDKALSATG